MGRRSRVGSVDAWADGRVLGALMHGCLMAAGTCLIAAGMCLMAAGMCLMAAGVCLMAAAPNREIRQVPAAIRHMCRQQSRRES